MPNAATTAAAAGVAVDEVLPAVASGMRLGGAERTVAQVDRPPFVRSACPLGAAACDVGLGRPDSRRQAKRITEEAAEHGVELDVVDISAQMERIYSVLSDVSHVRRSGLRGMVSVPLRRAVYRAHPDPFARAHATVSTVLAVEATILGVGDALAAFYGGPSYEQSSSRSRTA